MSERVQKKESTHRLAHRMETDERTAEARLETLTDTLYEAFTQGRSVTLPGFGGFYVKPKGGTWAFKFNPGQKLRALFG